VGTALSKGNTIHDGGIQPASRLSSMIGRTGEIAVFHKLIDEMKSGSTPSAADYGGYALER